MDDTAIWEGRFLPGVMSAVLKIVGLREIKSFTSRSIGQFATNRIILRAKMPHVYDNGIDGSIEAALDFAD